LQGDFARLSRGDDLEGIAVLPGIVTSNQGTGVGQYQILGIKEISTALPTYGIALDGVLAWGILAVNQPDQAQPI
jgi:hypothetical protein